MYDLPEPLRLYDELRWEEIKRAATPADLAALRLDLDQPPLTIAINPISNLRSQERLASDEIYFSNNRAVLSHYRWTSLQTAVLELIAALVPILDRLQPIATKTEN